MNKNIQFQSNYYQEINWNKIVSDSFSAVSFNSKITGIINFNKIIMEKNKIDCNKKEQIILLNQYGSAECDNQNLLEIKFDGFIKNNINLYYLKNEIKFHHDTHDRHKKLINIVIKKSYYVLLRVIIYTYDHIRQRFFHNTSLLKNSLIQNQFSDVLIFIGIIDHIFLSKHYDCKVVMNKIIALADKIGKLGGARSILKNNIYEFMFHLKIFQRIFL